MKFIKSKNGVTAITYKNGKKYTAWGKCASAAHDALISLLGE